MLKKKYEKGYVKAMKKKTKKTKKEEENCLHLKAGQR
jgi:hypothetical protein